MVVLAEYLGISIPRSLQFNHRQLDVYLYRSPENYARSHHYTPHANGADTRILSIVQWSKESPDIDLLQIRDLFE
jgi:hypothetical protein